MIQMLQKTLYRIYPGNLIVFYSQQESNTVVSLNIKLSKVHIIGQIVNTFPVINLDQGFILFSERLKHDPSIFLQAYACKTVERE